MDDITCSLISEHLENPTTLVSHLMGRSPNPASDLDANALSQILAACNDGSRSQRNRKLPAHSNSNGDGQDDGPIGNGSYPSSNRGATPPSGSNANANGNSGGNAGSTTGAGSGGVGAGAGAGAGAGNGAASNTQSSNTGPTAASSGGKLPFNPDNAPFTVTRRSDASKPASGDASFSQDITDDGYDGVSTSQHLSEKSEDKRPTTEEKKNAKSGAKDSKTSDCVGQADSITCGLQGLGL